MRGFLAMHTNSHYHGLVSILIELCLTPSPNLLAWYKRCRATKLFADDLERTRAFLSNVGTSDIERQKIFWRGDRIEWILARGYHDWFIKEIEEGRVLWPRLGIPGN
jgi:hypothetical protein